MADTQQTIPTLVPEGPGNDAYQITKMVQKIRAEAIPVARIRYLGSEVYAFNGSDPRDVVQKWILAHNRGELSAATVLELERIAGVLPPP